MKLLNINFNLKDIVLIGLILILFFMYVFKKPKTNNFNPEIDKLQEFIKIKSDSILYLKQQENQFVQIIEELKNSRENIKEKIRIVYKDTSFHNKMVDALDVQTLQKFLEDYSNETN